MRIETAQATAAHWDDVVTAFGRRGADPSWCWCQRFLDASAAGDNREALRLEVSTATVAPGLIAYVDGAPAGFALYAPPPYVPRSVAFPTSPVSGDAVLLMMAHVLTEFAGGGLGRMLVQ
ncbi:MAG: hypothetical protein ACXV8N_13905, partial [Ilumatobacteraceae bacterium]